MDEKLKQSILQTLAYFDIFNYPLTGPELHQYLWGCKKKINLADFLIQLSNQDFLGFKDGFYFLHGREEVVAERQSLVKILEKKMKIAVRGGKKIATVPFVRAVFVCNTLGGVGLSEDSDIDVFIIVKKGRLWLSRMLVTFILSIFGLRRTKTKINNRICLSFYVTDENLNLFKVALSEPDIYLVYWLDQLIPIYDPDNLHKSIMKANVWTEKYLSNGLKEFQVSDRWQVRLGGFKFGLKNFFEKTWGSAYGEMLEKQAKGIQITRMKKNYTSVQNQPDTRVVVNDGMLKFHENDRREEYRKKWEDKLVLCLKK